MDFIFSLDSQLFFFINHLPHPWWAVQIFLVFSFYPLIVWAGIGIVVLLYEQQQKHLWFFLYFILTLTVAGLITSAILKPLFQRPRPDISNPQQVVIVREKPALVAFANDYSFPSGHATIAFTGAYLLSKRKRGNLLAFYTFALLTGFSRIYLGKHYPLDVLAGALVGYTIAAFLYRSLFQRKPLTIFL